MAGVIKAAADTWVLDNDNTLLPSDAVMKSAIEAYESMKITPLRLFEEITEIKAGTGEPLPELPPVSVNVSMNWETVLNKPTSYPPAAHDHLGDSNVVRWQEGVSFKPETYPPDYHTHRVEWSEVQVKPESYPPSPHTHSIAWGEITGKPTLMTLAEITWIGDGAVNRVITLPFPLTSGDLMSDVTEVHGQILRMGSLFGQTCRLSLIA